MEGRGTMNRRTALAAGGAAILSGCLKKNLARPAWESSSVAILKAPSYEADLADIVRRGARECGLDVRGKRVLLKPNMVEFSRDTVINTDPRLVAAVAEVVKGLGAAEVRIGEGPGHRRDTLGMAEEAGYFAAIPGFEDEFADLNRDDVGAIENFGTLGRLWVPQTVLAADVIISIPKMKTHHWAGATLSMKNYFGLVPGELYGWPKNVLHIHGISESIVALARAFGPKSFAVVDGIVGMEGNGPIQGTPKKAGVIVMGRDLVAVDATCCRVMGIRAERVEYLEMARGLGWVEEGRVEQRGEEIRSVRGRFVLMPLWRPLVES